jgi:hypothetical protein
MIRVGKGVISSTRTTLSRNSPATLSSLQSRTPDIRDKYSVPLPSRELDHMNFRRIEGRSYAGPIPSWELDHMDIRRIAGSSISSGAPELKAHWILKEE